MQLYPSPPTAGVISIQWDNGSGPGAGPIGDNVQRDITTRADNAFDPVTNEANPDLFTTELYTGGATGLSASPYDKQLVLLQRGLYTITTAVFMSQSGVAANSARGNNFQHKFVSGGLFNMGSEQHVAAFGRGVITEQFLVTGPPVSLFVRWLNQTGVSQDVSAISSIVSRSEIA